MKNLPMQLSIDDFILTVLVKEEPYVNLMGEMLPWEWENEKLSKKGKGNATK